MGAPHLYIISITTRHQPLRNHLPLPRAFSTQLLHQFFTCLFLKLLELRILGVVVLPTCYAFMPLDIMYDACLGPACDTAKDGPVGASGVQLARSATWGEAPAEARHLGNYTKGCKVIVSVCSISLSLAWQAKGQRKPTFQTHRGKQGDGRPRASKQLYIQHPHISVYPTTLH
jgi:hypothetical protein